ncbi:MAG: nucleotidyltransferase family protein [Acidobacteriota bacterium]|nr:MAG: nucleotidyltransferase family protein [Acidobacteriota bacterium]
MSRQIAAIVLAAGESSRLCRPKQLVDFEGQPLVRRAATTALGAGCRPVIVVLGAHAEHVERALEGLDVETILNRDWRSGMASSMRAGLALAESVSPRADAAIMLLADQPEVSADLLREMMRLHTDEAAPVVACAYQDTLGVPALFDRQFWCQLTRVRGDRGARDWLRARADRVTSVPFPGAGVDIDDEQDLQRVR